MKRYLALVLALCLLLCACGGKTPNTDEGTAGQNTQQNTQQNNQQNVQQNTEKNEPTVLYRHPLTGAPLEQPWSGQVTAVVVNNLKGAMPQCGISEADLFYEVEVEGDITRCLALFTDLSSVGVIGPVRSARTAFNSIAVSFDAPLIHCGGSPGLALAGRYGESQDTIDNWQHIDQSYNDKYFFRDQERYNNGYAWEHTLFTTGEKLQKAIEDKGFYTPDAKTYGLQHKENVTLNGESAQTVTVKFKSGKRTILTYDAKSQQYALNMHGSTHIDGNTGDAVMFKNVIALYTDQWYAPDGAHKFYDTIGSGKGYAAINGQIVPIKWTRDTLRTAFTYTLEDGTPLTLDVGTTYVALVGIKHEIAYQ